MRAVDAEAGAERVEAVLGAGEFRARAMASVSTIRVMQTQRPAALAELVVEEAEIEAGIVRDQRRIADELEQLLADVAEARLVGEEAVGEAVHRLGLARHRPARD